MDIIQFYNQFVKSRKDELKKLKEEKIKNEKLILKSFLVFFLILPFSILSIRLINDIIINYIISFILLLSFCTPFIIILVKSKRKDCIFIFKEEIFNPFFKNCFEESLNYNYQNNFTKKEIKQTALILPTTTVHSTNILEFYLHGKKIKCGDITYGDVKRIPYRNLLGFAKRVNIFKHDFLIKIPITNNYNINLMVEPKKDYVTNKGIIKDHIDELENIMTNEYKTRSNFSEAFNNNFNIYNFSPQSPVNIENAISYLMNFYNKYHIHYKMLIREHYLYIILEGFQIIDDQFFYLLDFDETFKEYLSNIKKYVEDIKKIAEIFLNIENKLE